MGVLSKESAGSGVEGSGKSKWGALANPQVQGAVALAATIACTQGLPKMVAGMLARSRVGSSLAMVGAAAEAVAAPSVWASEGVQKSASFFTMIFVGFILVDTARLIHMYGPDDYVIATISLYLDFINLFLHLLSLLSLIHISEPTRPY